MIGAARLSAGSDNAISNFTYIGRGTSGMFSDDPASSYFNLPTGTQPGDIIILNTLASASADYAPTVTHPPGFIDIVSASTSRAPTSPNTNETLKVSYRQIPSDDLDLPRQYGMETYPSATRFMAVFRPNGAVNTIAAGGGLANIQLTGGISQTLSASAQTGPYIALGFMCSTGVNTTISPRTTSVTMTEVNNGANSHWMKYKFYERGTAGENITFTQEDETAVDAQSIFYLKFNS